MDDFSLVRKCIDGDTAQFRHIVDRHKDVVARVIYSMMQSKSDVEDLTQEVFIKAYRSLPKFKFDSTLQTWLYRIAINHTIDYLRKKKITSIISFDGLDEWLLSRLRGVGKEDSRVPEAINRKETKELVDWGLSKLKADERTILILREMEDLRYDEIANILGISIPAVKSRLFRARIELKKILTPALRGEV